MKKWTTLALVVTAFSAWAFRNVANNETADKMGQQYLYGIDVSHYQGKIDWEAVKTDNCYFAYAQATDGITYFDPSFSTNWKGIKAAGIQRGAYHFYQPDDDPIKQVESFLKAVGTYEASDLPLMLDLEIMNSSLSVDEYQERVKVCLEYLEERTNKKPIIYSYGSFANKYLNDTDFSEYTLWIAAYTNQPDIPMAWKENGWTLWQYSSSGTIKGIVGKVDLDKFQGNKADFKREMYLP